MIRRRWTLILSLAALAASALIGLGLMQMTHTSSLEAAQERAALLTPFATAIRVLLIMLTALLWEPLCRAIARRRGLDREHLAALLAWRWRAVGWLVVIELILGQNILNRFITS